MIKINTHILSTQYLRVLITLDLSLRESLNSSLNKIFNLNVTYGNNPNLLYFDQKNNFDCGPFVCLYAIRLQSHKNMNEKFNLDDIRKLVFQLADRNFKPNYIGHGNGIADIYEKNDISKYLTIWFANRHDIFVFSKTSTKNIIDKNRDYIVESFYYKQFKLIKFLITFFYVEKRPYIFIFCLDLKISNIFSISGNLLPLSLNFIAIELNDVLNKFLFDANVIYHCNQLIDFEIGIWSETITRSAVFLLFWIVRR